MLVQRHLKISVKQFLVLILSFVYISSSTGAFVHVHYCMGEVASWGFGANQSTVCGKCGMEEVIGETTGCCNNEQQVIKLVNDQKVSEANFHFEQHYVEAITPQLARFSSQYFPSLSERIHPTSAPPLRKVPLFLFNCIFRI